MNPSSYAQIVKSVTLSKDMLALIFKTYRNIIEAVFPLQLWVFTGVLNGCYTPGTAFVNDIKIWKSDQNVVKEPGVMMI